VIDFVDVIDVIVDAVNEKVLILFVLIFIFEMVMFSLYHRCNRRVKNANQSKR
jgi:hypothetical protein